MKNMKIDYLNQPVPRHGDASTCWMIIDGKPVCNEHGEDEAG